MTKRDSAFGLSVPAVLWAVAILIVYFAGLTMPLVGPDEPRYSQVAHEMFERSDWITPTLGGFHWFEKPPLLYWLQIISFNLFGVSEFAARFGSALFGLGTILSLWLLGRHADRGASSESGFANLLAILAASTVSIIAFAHGASFDIILTFPMTAAMVSFFVYDSSRKPLALLSFYFFIGLALLAKGLVGMLFPFAIGTFYLLLVRRMPDRGLVLSLFWGPVVAVAIASLWYIPMYLRHGYEFIDQFFIQHHFQRFTSNKYLHPQPFHFFFWVLPLMTIPWAPFFLAGVWRFGRRLFNEDVDRTSTIHRLRVLSLAWIAVPLVFFSFSGSKLPGYILPIVPPAIILAADFLSGFIAKGRFRRFAIYGVAAITFAITAVVAIGVAPKFAEADSVRHLFEIASDRGLQNSPVMMLHGISHNAEFYATGRIVRETDGKQKRFPGPKEVSDELRTRGGKALVIVPLEYLTQLLEFPAMQSELLGDNGEVALVVVELRQ